MDNFDLRKYLTENTLLKEEGALSQDVIDKLVAKAVGKKVEDVKNKEEVNEGVGLTLALLAPAILSLVGNLTNSAFQKFGIKDPASVDKIKQYNDKQDDIAKKVGIGTWGIKWLDNPFNDSPEEKKAKHDIKALEKAKDKEFGTKFGHSLVKVGHKLHHFYTWPIKKFLQGVAFFIPKDHKFSYLKDEDTIQKIADIIYAGVMIMMGIGHVIHDIKHFHGVKEAVDAMLNADKVGISIGDIAEVGLNAEGFEGLLTK